MELSTDFWDWVGAHAADDPVRLRLKYGASRAMEILQIETRRRHHAKLGEALSLRPRLLVPTSLAPEQASSWALASWHASLVAPGSRVADLTAGLGVDLLALGGRASDLTAVERDPAVADALRYNFPDAEVAEADCRDFVATAIAAGRAFDVIFIDPARRGAAGERLYALAACSPDVAALMPDLLRLAPMVIVKASPMLDIAHTLGELPSCSHIYAAGTTAECKEIVAVCTCGGAPAHVPVTAVTVGSGGLTFTRAAESVASPSYCVPAQGDYVYSPWPSVMKAAPYRLLCSLFAVAMLGPNTRLWTSAGLSDGFPGRAYRVDEVLPYASRHIKRYAAAHPAVGVTTRNFDIDAAALRRKLGLRGDSDRTRLFAVKGPQGEPLLITATLSE